MAIKITSVVFDLGGVLLDWNPDYLYRQLIPDAVERQAFLSHICTDAWHQNHDAGVSFADNAQPLLNQYANIPRIQALVSAWGARFGEMISGPIAGTVDIMETLHADGIKLYALTNCPSEAFGPVRTRFDFLSRFRDVVVSGDEHVKKPDPAIYKILLTRTGIDAASSIYIDDREENLVPARDLGFTTIRFTSPEALTTELRRHDLLSLKRCA
jgi:2-haloacid dehalogenase